MKVAEVSGKQFYIYYKRRLNYKELCQLRMI